MLFRFNTKNVHVLLNRSQDGTILARSTFILFPNEIILWPPGISYDSGFYQHFVPRVSYMFRVRWWSTELNRFQRPNFSLGRHGYVIANGDGVDFFQADSIKKPTIKTRKRAWPLQKPTPVSWGQVIVADIPQWLFLITSGPRHNNRLGAPLSSWGALAGINIHYSGPARGFLWIPHAVDGDIDIKSLLGGAHPEKWETVENR